MGSDDWWLVRVQFVGNRQTIMAPLAEKLCWWNVLVCLCMCVESTVRDIPEVYVLGALYIYEM